MRTFVFTLAAVIGAAALAGAAFAHPATEQFIPIGESPGANTVQGTAYETAAPATADGAAIVSVDVADAGYESYVVGPHTRIYIDRSEQGLANTVGTIEDVQAGRVVEVRIADPETRVAAWIKVRP
ncbi:MAG: hypothetical protein GC206_00840 [Alphaproteobacteria bacterium]|nr:hypothetical protein [Alphaproteobacteria bacterium]